MDLKIFYASVMMSVIIGYFCSAPVSAEPLRINPYPERAAAGPAAPAAPVAKEVAPRDLVLPPPLLRPEPVLTPESGAESGPEPEAERLVRPAAAAGHEKPAGPQWRAAAGADIRQVLEEWSREAGAGLIWDSDHGFTVLQPLAARGPYHRAVRALLDQYREHQRRPVATLHIDPAGRAETLVVRVAGAR